MKNSDIYLAPECLGHRLELVAVTPDLYVNGVRQPDPVGYSYDVLLREHASDKLRVHISGKQQIDEPLSGHGVFVSFSGLKVRPYVNRSTGALAFIANADEIKPVDTGKASKA